MIDDAIDTKKLIELYDNKDLTFRENMLAVAKERDMFKEQSDAYSYTLYVLENLCNGQGGDIRPPSVIIEHTNNKIQRIEDKYDSMK